MNHAETIEDKLGTEPTLQDLDPLRQGEDLHVVPDEFQGWALKDESSTEPEGYYDLQEEAIAAGRQLARSRKVTMFVHDTEGLVRDQSG
jgi:hypothetical protein